MSITERAWRIIADPNGFAIGQVLVDEDLWGFLSPEGVSALLIRHKRLDWSETDPEQRAINKDAVIWGGGIRSTYQTDFGLVSVFTHYNREFTRVTFALENDEMPEDHDD